MDGAEQNSGSDVWRGCGILWAFYANLITIKSVVVVVRGFELNVGRTFLDIWHSFLVCTAADL